MAMRYCKVCSGWHSLEAEWPDACWQHYARKTTANTGIIKDIEPYKSVAVDKATGQRPTIGGRAQHREFLRNNNYLEIGNEFVKPKREELSKSDRVSDIRRAMNDL